jgi:hypothetical protein
MELNTVQSLELLEKKVEYLEEVVETLLDLLAESELLLEEDFKREARIFSKHKPIAK